MVDAGAETVATVDLWLAEGRSAALRVPSVLLPYAWNVLLNPRHADATRSSVASIEPFHFDPRLWEPLAAER
jgi:RES domain-containing protein